MKNSCRWSLSAFLALCAGAAWAQECPDFVHRENITQYYDSGAVLNVTGTVVAGRRGGGIYKTALGENNPVMIPNTDGENSNSTDITEDGQWVLYNSGGCKLIRIDGQHKTSVPGASNGGDGACSFWWNAPSGQLEVVYRTGDNMSLHAVPVTLGDGPPGFGADHTVAQFNEVMEFGFGIAGNHLFARVNADMFSPKMVTIPDNGNGTATNADFWQHTNSPSWGCMCTISHDGTIVAFNTGYDQWVGCLANEFVLLRHKSVVLLPFQETSDPSMEWQNELMKENGVSVNWAPEKYLYLDPDNPDRGASAGTSNFWSDFKNWCYTNHNEYIVGDADCLPYNVGGQDSSAGSNMPDSGSIWLVHYPTNTWTMVMVLDGGQRLSYPAVWIDEEVGINKPPAENRLEIGTDLLQNSDCLLDVRGRCVVPGGQSGKRPASGIYSIKARDGTIKRIVIEK
jgi:hypothetical protein